MLHQIQIEFNNPEDVRELLSLAEQYDDITAIEEKSFTGDVTTIELYVSVAINILTIVGAAVNALIAKKKVSSVMIDEDKIELNNVSEDLIKRIVERKLWLDAEMSRILIDTLEWSQMSSNGKTPESEDSGVLYSLEFVRNTEISAC